MLTTFDNPDGSGTGAGPLNPKSASPHEMLLRNDGPETLWIASSAKAAIVPAGSELGEDVCPIAAGGELRVGIAPEEEYFYASASGAPIRFYVFYW